MHDNIDLILKRANTLLIEAYHDFGADEARKARLAQAFCKLNPGLGESPIPDETSKLPADPDGSQTLTAARFIAAAMGLVVVNQDALDDGTALGPQHIVIWRRMLGGLEQEQQNDARRELGRGAGMYIEIITHTSQMMVSFGQKPSPPSPAAAVPAPRQRSFF